MLEPKSLPSVLIINGAEVHPPQASGSLNTLLFEAAKSKLQPSHQVLTTVLADGYDIMAERHKFQQADLVIFQFPIFWFAAPSSLKQYVDDIYTSPGIFFGLRPWWFARWKTIHAFYYMECEGQ